MSDEEVSLRGQEPSATARVESSRSHVGSSTRSKRRLSVPIGWALGIWVILILVFEIAGVLGHGPEWPPNFTGVDRIRVYLEVATLLFLAVYVNDTARMAETTARALAESQEARAEATAPRIIVFFRPSPSQIAELVVANVGDGSARNISFTFNPPLTATEDGASDRVRAFFKPWALMVPKYETSMVLGVWYEYHEKKLPNLYEVTITYSGVENGREYQVHQVLDTTLNTDRMWVRQKGLHELVEQVEVLTQNFSDLAETLPAVMSQIAEPLNRLYELNNQRSPNSSGALPRDGTPSEQE